MSHNHMRSRYLFSRVSFCFSTDELFVVEVLVTDRDVDDRVLVTLLQADIPVVSSEWAIQCLITGRRVPYTKHQRYRHDYEEP